MDELECLVKRGKSFGTSDPFYILASEILKLKAKIEQIENKTSHVVKVGIND